MTPLFIVSTDLVPETGMDILKSSGVQVSEDESSENIPILSNWEERNEYVRTRVSRLRV